MRWTRDQEQILRDHGNHGPEYCRNLIYKRFGILRSVEATQRHASRIGAAMFQYQSCPRCGRVVKRLNQKSGLCEVCNYERLFQEQLEAEHRIRQAINRGGEADAITTAKRLYDAQRKKVSRLRRSVCGDIVDLSAEMSRPRSEAQEIPPDDSKASKKVAARSWH